MKLDLEYLAYPYPPFLSDPTQLHIARQDDSGLTLCGRDYRGWLWANPEPEEKEERQEHYATCKACIKIFNKIQHCTQEATKE